MWMSHALQAKMLAEMDEEFGITDLISEVVQEDKNKVIITCACGTCDDHVLIMYNCVMISSCDGHVTCSGSCDVWWIM